MAEQAHKSGCARLRRWEVCWGCQHHANYDTIYAHDYDAAVQQAVETFGGVWEVAEQKPAAEWEGRLHGSQEWEDIWPDYDGQMSYGADITYVEIRRKGTDALT